MGINPAAGGEVTATVPVEHSGELGPLDGTSLVTSIGTDAWGKIYIVRYSQGRILKLVDPTAPTVPPPSADFNHDRRPIWSGYREGTRQLASWYMGEGPTANS